MNPTVRTKDAAERVATLDAAIERLDTIKEVTGDASHYGLNVAMSVLEVIKAEELEKVLVQENITVKYSFTK